MTVCFSLHVIKSLLGFVLLFVRSFTAKDTHENYTYVFQLCGDAAGVAGAGVVQVEMKPPNTKTVVGKYEATQAIGGSKSLQNHLEFYPSLLDFVCVY